MKYCIQIFNLTVVLGSFGAENIDLKINYEIGTMVSLTMVPFGLETLQKYLNSSSFWHENAWDHHELYNIDCNFGMLFV